MSFYDNGRDYEKVVFVMIYGDDNGDGVNNDDDNNNDYEDDNDDDDDDGNGLKLMYYYIQMHVVKLSKCLTMRLPVPHRQPCDFHLDLRALQPKLCLQSPKIARKIFCISMLLFKYVN